MEVEDRVLQIGRLPSQPSESSKNSVAQTPKPGAKSGKLFSARRLLLLKLFTSSGLRLGKSAGFNGRVYAA